MNIKLTLRQLSALRELARTQNFTQAAVRLHTTQSNLSLAVQEAESLLGAKLFDRSTKHCRLTAVGREFLPVVERVLGDLQWGIDNVQANVQLQKGVLSIGTSALLASGVVAEMLADYRRKHPNIGLRIEDNATAEHVKLLRGGQIELAIGMYSEMDADLVQHKLFDVPLVLFAHKTLKLPEAISWKQLAQRKLVSIVRNSSVGQLIDKTWWQLHERHYQPEIECHHWGSVLAMSQSLKSMCIAPSHAAQKEIYPQLKRIDIIDPVVMRTISISHLRDHELSPAAQAFLDGTPLLLQQMLRDNDLLNL